jgi:Domain of unknown function (DUF4145)
MPDPPDPRLAVVCRACGYPSSAHVAGKITGDGDDEDGPFERSLIQCEFCDAASLVRQDEASEAAPVEVWPTSQRTLHEGIPRGVRDGVFEARKCFEAGAFLATAVMVRRAIEGFCVDQGVSHKTLHRALRELVQRNVIDARLLEWADGLRVLGNVGAHFTDQVVTRQDASDALDLIEAMLDYVYVFSTKFEQFKARRDAPTRS